MFIKAPNIFKLLIPDSKYEDITPCELEKQCKYVSGTSEVNLELSNSFGKVRRNDPVEYWMLFLTQC